MRLEHPQSEKLEQGAIFNCASVPGYKGFKCYGIVVTARCDLEHNKHSVVNYLPVVPFRAWVQQSLCYLLAKRLSSELAAEIASHMNKKGLSSSLRETFTLADIIEKEFQGQEKKQLLIKASHSELASRVMNLNWHFDPDGKAIIQLAGKRFEKIVDELVHQKLSEFYFLECADICDTDSFGFIVLLRQMQSIECALANKIVKGIEADDIRNIPDANHTLTFEFDPICMITGVLRSPDVEHLAQCFANMFVRIGLEDHAELTLSRLCDAIKS